MTTVEIYGPPDGELQLCYYRSATCDRDEAFIEEAKKFAEVQGWSFREVAADSYHSDDPQDYRASLVYNVWYGGQVLVVSRKHIINEEIPELVRDMRERADSWEGSDEEKALLARIEGEVS